MIDYLLLDVFTERAFSGNPLAVVFGADDLDATSMQTIAAELNLSETVFLATPDDQGRWPTRIFTPRVELPFAGHPTVGAAIALALTGRIDATEGSAACVLLQAVGAVPVEVRYGASISARLAVPQLPTTTGEVARTDAARLVGLDVASLHPTLAPARWSAGVEFTVVPLRDVGALGVASPSPDAEHLYVVTPTAGEAARSATWRARMFATAMGITEDPATGAAAAAAAGFLAASDGTGSDQRSWTIVQGVEMGRPSRIEVHVRRSVNGELASVQIEGAALIVGSGSLIRPDGETA